MLCLGLVTLYGNHQSMQLLPFTCWKVQAQCEVKRPCQPGKILVQRARAVSCAFVSFFAILLAAVQLAG